MDRRALALEIARELGFDLAGVTPLAPPRAASRFEEWLDAGRHGSMDYLERNRERIIDPRSLVPGARSLLVVGLSHARGALHLEGGGRIARYAAGRDYHNIMGKMLIKLGKRLAAEGFGDAWRKVVDAGPLLERSHAAEAGLGFESKAANLLHPDFGPWFFLGELLIEEELEPTAGPAPGSCGTCRACIDACPTGAILEAGVVHSPACISYQTIENRGPIPHEIREGLGDWTFGCDICSEVCPWGRSADDTSARFGTHPGIEAALLAREGLVRWIRPGFDTGELNGSPLRRAKREGLARNAAITLGHHPSEEGREALLEALSFDPAPMVREAAAWGLARGHGEDDGVHDRLDEARGRESDEQSATGMARSRRELS